MGWVTLACRSKEDLSVKNWYQSQLLSISRDQRATARAYQLQETQTQNDQSDELDDLEADYKAERSVYRTTISYLKSAKSIYEKSENGEELTEEEQNVIDYISSNEKLPADLTSDDLENYIDQYDDELSDLQEDYESDVNDVKDMYDIDLEMIENEANDEDTMYESFKTDYETQLESVSNEKESVDDARSTAAQESAPKLS